MRAKIARLPSISVVTVALNAAGTIRGCLHSVRSQTHPAEHVVVDGGSNDGTLDILAECAGNLARVVSEPDDGIYHAMNKGIGMAGGDVIGILNADDFYADENTLAEVAEVFAGSGADSCYGDLVYVDPADVARVLRSWRAGAFARDKFRWGWMPPHPTFFVRAPLYRKYGVFNTSLGSAADYELMLRLLLKHRITTAYIPRVLVRMRSGGVSNASLKNRILANHMDRKAWQVNHLRPYPWTLWLKPLRKVTQYVGQRPWRALEKAPE